MIWSLKSMSKAEAGSEGVRSMAKRLEKNCTSY